MSGRRDELWHQDKPGIKGVNEYLDEWGYQIATGDYNGNGRFDLAITSLGDQAIAVLYSNATGLTAADQRWGGDGYSILGGQPPG